MHSHRQKRGTRTRRSVLTTVAVGGAGALAGCLGGDESGPDPVALDEGQECDNCGMQIDMHPGPVGEAFYGEDAPETLPDDRPNGLTWFCSTKCTYNYRFEHEQRGYEPQQSYGTDYSGVDYELVEEGRATVISAHLEAAAFEDLQALTFDVGSDVEGAMGKSLIGFSDSDDASTFADENGGELVEHGEVSRELLSGLSM